MEIRLPDKFKELGMTDFKLNDDEENADQQRSLADAGKYGSVSGRGGTAIKYALAQIGDRYIFGADGLTTWDCSGLTMRAFQSAGDHYRSAQDKNAIHRPGHA